MRESWLYDILNVTDSSTGKGLSRFIQHIIYKAKGKRAGHKGSITLSDNYHSI